MTNRQYRNRHKRMLRALKLMGTYHDIVKQVRALTGAARDESTVDAVKRAMQK